MTIVDTEQQRLLERLRQAGGDPVSFARLRADGILFPAPIVRELVLGGYEIDRVLDQGRIVGVRLIEPEPPAAPLAGAHRRLRRQRATEGAPHVPE